MSWLDMVLVGVGMAMDASAVAAVNGIAMERVRLHKAVVIGLSFGLFQGLMPLIGYFAGSVFSAALAKIAPWIAFALLAMVGVNMIRESLAPDQQETETKELSPGRLLTQSVATSIDALAVGVGFAMINANIFAAASVIALVTFLLSLVAVYLGHSFGSLLASKATLVGGVILILIGLKLALF